MTSPDPWALAIESAAKVAEVMVSIMVERRDNMLADNNIHGALVHARQSQTCDDVAAAIRALPRPSLDEMGLKKIQRGLDLAFILSGDVPITRAARKELTDAYDALAALTQTSPPDGKV